MKYFKNKTGEWIYWFMSFILLFFAQVVTSQQVDVITIDSCQLKAKANYPLIKQYDLIEQSTEYTLSNANKAYLPKVSLTAIGGYIINGLPTISAPGQPTPDPSKVQAIGIVQINQILWDGGATRTQKEIAKASAEVEKSNIDVSLFVIRERVNQVFFGILLIDEQLKQLDILNDNLSRNLEKVKLSMENGIAYQSDVDEMKAELLNLEQRRIEFVFTRKGYVQMLSLLTGQQFEDKVKPEQPVILENTQFFQNNRPELDLYANQLKLVEAQAEINKVTLMPKIGLLGAGIFIGPGISFGSSTINNLSIAGLNLSWEINGLYKNSNNKNLDKIKSDKILNQQETLNFNNNLQLTQVASEIEKQKQIVVNDVEIVKLKSDITKSYQLKYDNGISSMNDLINAMNKESEARANQALHKVQLLMATYNYKTISGN